MGSTTNILIVAVIVGIIVLGAIWTVARNRMSGDVPPAKLYDDSASAPAKRQDASASAAEAASAPAPVAAPQPPEPAATPKAKAVAPGMPATKRSAPPKPTPVRTPTAKKVAPKKAAPSAPVPLTAIGVPGTVGPADSLLQIKGLGPKLNTLLDGLGITRFDQIAAWSAEDAAKVDEHLGAFKGRIERDSWIEQADFLAKGAIAEFEAKFGKLDNKNA